MGLFKLSFGGSVTGKPSCVSVSNVSWIVLGRSSLFFFFSAMDFFFVNKVELEALQFELCEASCLDLWHILMEGDSQCSLMGIWFM